jgi:antagonist of KipI
MTIRVLRAGVLATLQDLGRPGLQHQAIVPGGAMDAVSHRIANALVGNFDDAATIEIALAGPELAFDSDALIALYGAGFEPQLDGAPLPLSRPVLVRTGARLRVGRAATGAFGYLAVAGGIAVEPVLGSRSTYLAGAFGGLDGRALATGSTLPLAPDAAARAAARFAKLAQRGRPLALGSASATSVRWFVPTLTLSSEVPQRLRVIEGVHAPLFDAASRRAFFGEPWRVTGESNRMGYRLSGPTLALAERRDIASQGVCLGTVQVPAGGQPIVLMADRQTTGGYPRIAEVVSADVPRLAQIAPGGGSLRFEAVTLEAADLAREALLRRLHQLIDRLRWEYGDADD